MRIYESHGPPVNMKLGDHDFEVHDDLKILNQIHEKFTMIIDQV